MLIQPKVVSTMTAGRGAIELAEAVAAHSGWYYDDELYAYYDIYYRLITYDKMLMANTMIKLGWIDPQNGAIYWSNMPDNVVDRAAELRQAQGYLAPRNDIPVNLGE